MTFKKHNQVTASEVDWSFLSNPEVVAAIDLAADRVAAQFPGAEVEDAKQEIHLYFASRPQLTNNYIANGELSHLGFCAYRVMCSRVKVAMKYHERIDGGW